jgi:hypothetical protein
LSATNQGRGFSLGGKKIGVGIGHAKLEQQCISPQNIVASLK